MPDNDRVRKPGFEEETPPLDPIYPDPTDDDDKLPDPGDVGGDDKLPDPRKNRTNQENQWYEDRFYSAYSKLFTYNSSSYSVVPSEEIRIGFYEDNNKINEGTLLQNVDYVLYTNNNIKIYPSEYIRRNIDNYDIIKHKLLDINISFLSNKIQNLAVTQLSPDGTEIKIYYQSPNSEASDAWKYIINNINILYDKYNYFLKDDNNDIRIINAKIDSSLYNEQLEKLNDKRDKLVKQLFKEFDAYVNMPPDQLVSASLGSQYAELDENDIDWFISQNKEFQALIKKYEALQKYYFIDLKLEKPYKESSKKKCFIYERRYNSITKNNIVFWQLVGGKPLLPDDYISTAQKIKRQTVSSSFETLVSGSNEYQIQRYFDLIYDKNKRVDDLNIDYSDFSNFVYFGSATGQVQNAYNKCLEYSSSFHSSSKFDVLDAFTTYQKWVYDYKFRQYSSSQFVAWYNDQYTSASLYDNENRYSLIKNLPEEMKLNLANENLILLMKSYGDFFDDIKTYIDSLGNTFNFNFDYDRGLPKEVIYAFSDFFGWKLYEGFDIDALNSWLRINPTSETDIAGYADITREKWLRILNCIPYLNKIRGTRKSIDAILNIYGIPNTLLEVHEYGGYDTALTQSYNVNEYEYYLNFTTSSQYITIPESIISASIHNENYTIEMMFKPSQALTSSYLFSSSNNGGSVYFTQNALTASYGNIVFDYGGTTSSFVSDFELFNTNYWYHFITQVSGSNFFKMYTKVFDDAELIIDESKTESLLYQSMSFHSASITANDYILSVSQNYEINMEITPELYDTVNIIMGKDSENYIGLLKSGEVITMTNNRATISSENTMILRASAGRFNFSWNNPDGRLWTFPEGTVLYSDGTTPIETSTAQQPDVIIPAGGGNVILRSSNFNGNWSLSDINTDAVYIGDLSDLPALSYYLNLGNCTNITGDLSDLPALSYLLNLDNCTNITGDLSDLPALSYYLNLGNCTNITGDLSDLPALSYYLNLDNCTNITGDLSDLPALSYLLSLGKCTNITGDLSDLPALSYYLNLYKCTNITGDLSDLPALSYLLSLYNCSNITGAYTNVSGNNVPTYTYFDNTGMSATDMDNTLIAYAATTKNSGTFRASGMTRTEASDDAVSTLTGRGWSITGITKV